MWMLIMQISGPLSQALSDIKGVALNTKYPAIQHFDKEAYYRINSGRKAARVSHIDGNDNFACILTKG